MSNPGRLFCLLLIFEIINLMHRHQLLKFIAVLLISISFSASAETHNKAWKPQAIKYDWLQLTSGEWLEGELKSMYNTIFEFDSDKLNLLLIDWEDVEYLQSYRQFAETQIPGWRSIISVIYPGPKLPPVNWRKPLTITDSGN